jgi:hypothetical protein
MILHDAIKIFSEGIALAEGFYVTGSRARRNNNPGNLTVDTIGKATGKDGMFAIYATAGDGWNALYKQVELILTDASNIYNSDMTLRQIGQKYTTTDQLAWSMNVANKLGIDIDTPVSTLLTTAATNVGLLIVIVFGLLWYFKKGSSDGSK